MKLLFLLLIAVTLYSGCNTKNDVPVSKQETLVFKKDVPDAVKHKKAILFYGVALLIILIAIPWPFRNVGAGRVWFPGM